VFVHLIEDQIPLTLPVAYEHHSLGPFKAEERAILLCSLALLGLLGLLGLYDERQESV
jgi:hypothetical protein